MPVALGRVLLQVRYKECGSGSKFHLAINPELFCLKSVIQNIMALYNLKYIYIYILSNGLGPPIIRAPKIHSRIDL